MLLTFTLILSLTVIGVLCWRLRHLQLELNTLTFDVSYGVLTRQGLDHRWRQTMHAAVKFEIVFVNYPTSEGGGLKARYSSLS